MQLADLHVIIVEDSIMARNKLSEYLEEIGIKEVSEAGGGEMALSLLDKLAEDGRAPHLMLLDWNMPQMDGIGVLKALQDMPKYSDLKVLMVSAERDKSQIVAALSKGANGFISKPVTKEGLEAKINEVVNEEEASSNAS